MPVLSNLEQLVTLDQLRMLLRDHLWMEVCLPEGLVPFDPKYFFRVRVSWCALATTRRQSRLERLLKQCVEESGHEDVLAIESTDVKSITSAAVVLADRFPPRAVRRVDAELARLDHIRRRCSVSLCARREHPSTICPIQPMVDRVGARPLLTRLRSGPRSTGDLAELRSGPDCLAIRRHVQEPPRRRVRSTPSEPSS